VSAHWWLRLRWYEWSNVWRINPFRHAAALLLWVLPCVLVPLSLWTIGADRTAVQEWVLSFDIPLALLLTVVVAVQATPAVVRASNPSDDAWILPLANQRLIATLQWLRDRWRAARWPIRFALSGLLLAIGTEWDAALTEWLLIAALAFVAGVTLARLHAPSTPRAAQEWSGTTRRQGLAALSAVPLHAARRQLDLRRMLFLCIPVLLAAPMGTPVYKIALGVACWMPLVFLATSCREAGHAVTAMRSWLPLSPWRVRWWVWRQLVLLIIVSAAAAWTIGSRI
jgi:hypothetical protein